MVRPFLPHEPHHEVGELPEDEIGHEESTALVEVPPRDHNEERLRELIAILTVVGGRAA